MLKRLWKGCGSRLLTRRGAACPDSVTDTVRYARACIAVHLGRLAYVGLRQPLLVVLPQCAYMATDAMVWVTRPPGARVRAAFARTSQIARTTPRTGFGTVACLPSSLLRAYAMMIIPALRLCLRASDHSSMLPGLVRSSTTAGPLQQGNLRDNEIAGSERRRPRRSARLDPDFASCKCLIATCWSRVRV